MTHEQRIDNIKWKAERVRSLPNQSVARYNAAAEVVVNALQLARDLCGDEVLKAAYRSAPDGSDRSETLRRSAARLHLLAFLFAGLESGPGTNDELIAELNAVASGDAPALLSQIGKRTNHRVLLAKFDALRWEAYLDGLGIERADRRHAIEKAFRAEWETVRRRWHSDVAAKMTAAALKRRLGIDQEDGRRGLRRWTMSPGESWEDALQRSGDRYWSMMTRQA